MEVDISSTSKIVKKTLYAGSEAISFEPETKVSRICLFPSPILLHLERQYVSSVRQCLQRCAIGQFGVIIVDNMTELRSHDNNSTSMFCLSSQVTFHFQTRLCNEDKTLIDDSRKWNKPMQLILGRKFKLPVWEVLVKNMALNEVAHFVIDKSVSNSSV